jgi:hypothetical protein
MSRKRAPGGGRKPKGTVPMRSQVGVRMPDDMRAQLEAAARKRGHSLSDELLARLRASFARDDEQQRDPLARALNSLIFRIARDVRMFTRSKEWTRNPFAFRAFKLGVAKLLDAFDPPGDIHAPVFENDYRPFEAPEDLAAMAADTLLTWLFYARPLSKDRKTQLEQELQLDSGPYERELYELLRVRNYLLPKMRG